ncbi:MAG: YitT family protein [Clostridia bacterium]|nr:YitT family protein [Clostridia bacterium]
MLNIKNKKIKQILLDILTLTAGAVIFATGVACFLDPNSIAPGGISGVAIIITKFFDVIPTGTLIALINVPILLVGTLKFGFKFLASTMYAVLVSSVAVDTMGALVGPLTDNLLLAAVGGAVLVGTGVGLVFRTGATTGGTDVIVKLLRTKWRHLPTGIVFGFVDGMVCLTSGIVFKNIEVMIYAGIALMLQSMIMNKVLYGGDGARMIYIISSENQEIAKRLMKDVDVGATFFKGNGAYSGQNYEILMVVMRAKLLPQARDVVKQIDDGAFMIVTNATSVFGEGFKKYDSEEV